ncbi:hypothetical protein C8J57DRAFT_1612154 [Mycena rebaudengoi]|nr:hypothetical protein C8J57DRAFT_1612154 [Mycena rebaudengoi]
MRAGVRSPTSGACEVRERQQRKTKCESRTLLYLQRTRAAGTRNAGYRHRIGTRMGERSGVEANGCKGLYSHVTPIARTQGTKDDRARPRLTDAGSRYTLRTKTSGMPSKKTAGGTVPTKTTAQERIRRQTQVRSSKPTLTEMEWRVASSRKRRSGAEHKSEVRCDAARPSSCPAHDFPPDNCECALIDDQRTGGSRWAKDGTSRRPPARRARGKSTEASEKTAREIRDATHHLVGLLGHNHLVVDIVRADGRRRERCVFFLRGKRGVSGCGSWKNGGRMGGKRLHWDDGAEGTRSSAAGGRGDSAQGRRSGGSRDDGGGTEQERGAHMRGATQKAKELRHESERDAIRHQDGREGGREGGRKDSRAGDAASTLRSSFGGYTNRNLFPWIKDTQDVSTPMPTLDVVRPSEATSLEACVARVHRGGRRKARLRNWRVLKPPQKKSGHYSIVVQVAGRVCFLPPRWAWTGSLMPNGSNVLWKE